MVCVGKRVASIYEFQIVEGEILALIRGGVAVGTV